MIRTAALSACRALGAVSVRAPATTITTTTAGTRAAPSLSKALSTSIEPAEEQATEWRFAADDRTQSMVVQAEHGLSQSVILTLNSKAPITSDLMEEALLHLYDKIESLRLCLRPRDGQLWVADMPRRKLDFQVVSGTDLEEQHYAIVRSPFNHYEGPLWKAWLMPCPADAPCAIPEVKAAFPHQCHLLVSANHAVNDGVMMLTMREAIVRIIDSLLEGAPVDTKPIGELRDGVEAREAENRIKAELLSDPERLLTALRRHENSKHLPLLMEAYGVPNEANRTTKYLEPVLLDAQMVEKIAAKCRSTGATINACFTAALNISMMELAREAGLERDVYNISTRHPVDARRLMKNCTSLPLGFHSIPFTQCTSTPRDAKKNFWQYVEHLDAELRDKLKRNAICEQRVLEALTRPEGFTHEAKFASRHLPDCDFLFSNLYFPKATQQQGIGKNVQITAEGNYMGFHNENIAVAQGIFSARNQVRFQMAHSTGTITGRVADRYLEKNIAVLHDISRMVD